MIELKTKGNFKTFVKGLESMEKSLDTGDFLQGISQLVNASIQTRVQRKGIGSDGSPLKAYSKKYGAWKAATGRQVGYRDLTYSGKMWQSLTSSKIQGGSRLFFAGAEQANKAKGNESRTPFFGLSDKEKNIIKRELRKLKDKL